MTRRWLPLGPTAVPNGQFGSGSSSRFHGEGEGVVSGRVTAIAFSHSGGTLYVGTASGGLWQSGDEGVQWTPAMDGAPSLVVGAIGVASNERIYVGTGEHNSDFDMVMRGVGILFSDSGGQTWSLLGPQLTPAMTTDLIGERIARLVVHPSRPNEIYAATSIGLFVMVENPSTHALEWDILSRGQDCCDVAVDFTDPDKPRVWAAFQASDVVRFDGDPLNTALSIAGRFTRHSAGIPVVATGRVALALAVVSGQPTTVWAAFERARGLQTIKVSRGDVSHGSGGSWDDAPDLGQLGGAKQVDYNLVLAVDPRNPSRVYFGADTLWRRDGSSWHDVSGRGGPFGLGSYQGIHADQHALAFDPVKPNVVWAGNDGGIFRSDDSGEHFYPRNRGLATFLFYSLDHDETQPAVLIGGSQDNGGLRYLGHPAWRLVVDGDGTFVAIEPSSPRDWYIGEPETGIEHAGPGDRKETSSFHESNRGLPSGIDFFRSTIACAPSEPGTMFFAPVVSSSAALYWSHGSDGHGKRWERIEPTHDAANPEDITAVVVAPSDPKVVYFGRSSNMLFRLDLQGSTWTMTTIPGTPSTGASWRQIVVDPTHSDQFWAVLGSTAGPPGDPVLRRVWQGTPAGVTAMAALPDVIFPSITIDATKNNVNAIALDPANPGTFYVGTDYGVYQLVGAGPWQRFSDGLPQAAVITALRLHPSRRLRAATMGRSVWECALDELDRSVDIYVRDSVVDIGRADEGHPTPESAAHPFNPSDIAWTDGIDIKLDTERRFLGGFASLGSEGYDGVVVDHLGFEELDSEDPRSRARSRVYVQVHNRGPDPVSSVQVRVYQARKGDTGYPPLPANFWGRFPFDGFDTTSWTALDTWATLSDVRPGTPRVARFDASFSGAGDTIGLLAVISCNDDPLPTAILPLDVETAARSFKHVALKEVTVDNPSYAIVLLTLGILGVVVGGIALAERST